MKVPVITVHLFQRVLHAWVLLFLVTALPLADLLWMDPVSPVLPAIGWRDHLVHPLGSWLPPALAPAVLTMTLALAAWGVRRPGGMVRAVLLWAGYAALMQVSFTASSGGQQLIANLLFWNIPLSCMPHHTQAGGLRTWLGAWGLWAIRLQLLVAYAASALYKLEGTQWTSGAALGIVASDPGFGPSWLVGSPLLPVITWAMLGFQFTFPLAVWWHRTRLAWMALGVLFHGATAVWMGVPEMAFAFLVAYVSWLSAGEVEAVRKIFTLGRAAPATAR